MLIIQMLFMTFPLSTEMFEQQKCNIYNLVYTFSRSIKTEMVTP